MECDGDNERETHVVRDMYAHILCLSPVVDQQEQDSLIRILAAILHTSNIKFTSDVR